MSYVPAAENEDKKEVEKLLKSVDDFKLKEEEGGSLLHAAARDGDVDTFIFLSQQQLLDPYRVDEDGRTVLHEACSAGQYSMVAFLTLKYRDLLQHKDKASWTALHHAASSGNVRVLRFLLSKGMDVNSVLDDGRTVLHTACEKRQYEMVKYLINTYPQLLTNPEHSTEMALEITFRMGNVRVLDVFESCGVNIQSVLPNGQTYLHIACSHSKLEMVQYLVTKHPEMMTKEDQAGQTTLHHAARGGNVQVFKFIVGLGADIYCLTKDGQTVLQKACESGSYEMATYLGTNFPALMQKADNTGKTVLHYAAKGGNAKILYFLLQQGLDVYLTSHEGCSVLHIACKYGHMQIVDHLNLHYQDLIFINDCSHRTVLFYSALGGNECIFKSFLEYGHDPMCFTAEGETVLHAACKAGKYQMVNFLLERYPVLRYKLTNNRFTPLHYSAMTGNLQIFQRVQEDALLRIQTKGGRTVLHIACQYGHDDLVMYLIRKFPFLKWITKQGYTAIHACASGGSVKTFKLLVREGFYVYSQTLQGQSVLHEACLYGNEDLVKYLVPKYPDLVDKTNNKGTTACDLAEGKGYKDICLYLQDFTRSLQTEKEHNKHHVQEETSRVTTEQLLKKSTQAGARHKVMDNVIEDNERKDGKQWNNLDDQKLNTSKTDVLAKRFALQGHTDLLREDDQSSGFASSPPSDTQTNADTPESPEISQIEEDEDINVQCSSWSSQIQFPDPEMIRDYIQDKQSARKEIKSLLQWTCHRFESTFEDPVDQIWVGYTLPYVLEPMVVAITKFDPPQSSLRPTFDTFDVVYRKQGQVSTEAREIAEHEMSSGLHFTSEEGKKIQNCITKHSKMLMSKHSNLEIVSASKIKSRKYGLPDAEKREQTCIVLYVHVKGIIPFQEEPFPQELDGFPVDIREGKFVEYSNSSDYHQNLLMGCQIVSAYGKAGSLGGFVQLENGNIGCLTCWHVFQTESSKADLEKDKLNHTHFKREVFQPDMTKIEHKFGRVIDAKFNPGDENIIGVDAALIEIDDPQRCPLAGGFPDATSEIAGFSPEMPMVFNSGKVFTKFEAVPKTCNVVKYGCKTDHTVGILRLAGTAVRRQTYRYYISEDKKEENQLYQQFEVFQLQDQPFANFGDSGSLVFLVSDLQSTSQGYDIRALGLLVGGTSYNTTIVTPIWAVLQSFNLPLQLLSFPGHHLDDNEVIYDREEDSRLGTLESDMSTVKTDINFLKSTVKDLGSNIENRMNIMDNSIQEMGITMSTNMQGMSSTIMTEMRTILQTTFQRGPDAFQNNAVASDH